MNDQPEPIPEWITRGKSIRQLIKELNTFEDLDSEVRISLDHGDTHSCISLVVRKGPVCILMNCETGHHRPWQEFRIDTEES